MEQTENKQDQANRNILHFGCKIYICFCQEDGKEFFATAEGFTKRKVRLKTKSYMEKQGDFTSGIFKVYPSFYESQYRKTKKQYEEKKQLIHQQMTPVQKRQARHEIPKQIQEMEQESELNYDQYEKLKGTPILYGQTIQLLHVNSNKFLFYDLNNVSDYDPDNLRIGLQEEYSDETQFKILPSFSYQSESQGYIYDEDIVYIVSNMDSNRKMIGEPYLHASKSVEVPEQFDDDGSKLVKKEMNVSTDKKSNWKIKIFSEYIDERKGFLSVTDNIWINFSEQDLNLVAQKSQEQNDQNQQNQNYLKFENCENTEKYKKFIGNSNGIFIIESENMQQGGLVEWQNLYRLRHLTTNQYLALGENNLGTSEISQQEHSRPLQLVEGVKSASLFQFEMIYSTLSSKDKHILTKYLQKDSYFRLKGIVNQFNNTNLIHSQVFDQQVRFQPSIEKLKSANQLQDDKNAEYWLKTADPQEYDDQYDEFDNVQDAQYIPLFSTIKKEENVFKLAKANANEFRMTCFLLSCMKTIKKTLPYLSPEFFDKISANDGNFQTDYKKFLIRIGRLEKCLYDLNLFCHNRLEAYLYVDQDYNSINSFIQNVLREQLFIELLVKLLVEAFPKIDYLVQIKQIENTPKQNQKGIIKIISDDRQRRLEVNNQVKEEFVLRKKKVCTYIYKLLSSICLNNLKNQEKASNYLPIFATHSKFIPTAMDCIIQIIRNFEELLLTLRYDTENEDNSNANTTTNMSSVNRSRQLTNQSLQQISALKKNTSSKSQFQKFNYNNNNKVSGDQNQRYESLVNELQKSSNFRVRQSWNLIEFFCKHLKQKEVSENPKNINTKRELLKFLGVSATYLKSGVNVNQEGIFDYIINKSNPQLVYQNNILLRIYSDGPILYVNVYDEDRKLIDIIQKAQNNQKAGIMNKEHIIGGDHQLTENNQFEQNKPKIEDSQLLHLIQDQINFYASMVNSRNNTWKSFVEKSINVASLVASMANQKFTHNFRAIGCHLLNQLYVDQEPRRTQKLPELCKIVQDKKNNHRKDSFQSDMSDGHTQAGLEITQDKVKVGDIKKNINEYIKQISDIIKYITNDMVQKDKEKDNKQKLKNYQILQKLIVQQSPEVYNNLTYEIMKLLKLLIDFGKFNIASKNGEFFEILRCLIVIFEFDKTYPEGRKILHEKREENKTGEMSKAEGYMKEACSCLKKIFDMVNVMNVLKNETKSKNKKKKIVITDIAGDDMGMQESFMKQTDVLKKILKQFYSDDQDDIEFKIKEEICDILNKYLDYKHNCLLDNLKDIFQNMVDDKLLATARKHPEKLKKEAQTLFNEKIKTHMSQMIPIILSTGTEVDQLNNYFKERIPKQQDIININQILGFPIFPSLIVQFCLTQNIDMEQKILQILCRFYNQRKEFAELTSDLLILFDVENIKILKSCQKKIKVLAKNVDESEVWLKDLNKKKILKDTIQQFKFFTKMMLQGSKLNPSEDNITDGIPNKIDPIRQNIAKHLNVYSLAVSLIKENIGILDYDKEDGSQVDPNMIQDLKALFKQCFQFLKFFVIKNVNNQNLLSEHLVALLVGMHNDLGQVDLFCEIFRENKKICLEKSQILTDDFIKILWSNGRQAKFLEFFNLIQRCGNEFLLQNQKHVLNLFLDNTNKKYILYLNESSGGKNYRFSFKKQKHNSDGQIGGDEPFEYHAKLIECLAITTIGKEGMYYSESKLRQTISLKYIFELLKKQDYYNIKLDGQPGKIEQERLGMTKLKLPLLKYTYYTFLESEKISDEFNKYIDEFKSYIHFETQRFKADNRKPTPQYLHYFFEQFLYIIAAYLRSFSKEVSQEPKSEQNQNQIQGNQNLLEPQQEAGPNEPKTMQEALENLRLAIEQKFDVIIEEIQENSAENGVSEIILLRMKLQKEIFMKLQEKNFKEAREIESQKSRVIIPFWQQQTLSEIKSQVVNVEELDQEINNGAQSKDAIMKNLWDIFLEEFLNSKMLTQEIEKEHMVFAQALDKVDKIYENDKTMSEIVNKGQIFSKLIQFLQKSHDNPENLQTFQLILNALGNFIYTEEDINNMEKLEPSKQEEKQKEIESNQNFLNQNGAVYMIFYLLSEYSNPKLADSIFNDIVNFGIKLLRDGNREVQKTVFQYFKNFTSSEVFFMRIHKKIEEEYDQIKKEIQKEEEKIFLFQDQGDQIFNILQFLQLFAEGHYLDLQNYVRQQDQNYHNYDLIQVMIELLNTYFKYRKQDYFNNMIQCFETLTEYIQGPCQQNQIALIQDNFLDLSNNLLSIDEIQEEDDEEQRRAYAEKQNNGLKKQNSLSQLNIQEKAGQQSSDSIIEDEKSSQKQLLNSEKLINIDINSKKKTHYLPKQMIAELKYKCSVTLISLLEARKDDTILLRMSRILDLKVLKQNIETAYLLYILVGKEKYDEELFEHVEYSEISELDHDDKEYQEKKEKSSFIIETGFNLYIVYQNFMEVKKDQVLEIKQETDTTQDWIKWLQEFIVGKIIKLGWDVVIAVNKTRMRAQALIKVGKDSQKSFYEKFQSLKAEKQDLSQESILFFRNNTVHIEVQREDKQLEKAYFYRPPFCNSLDKDSKTKFNREAIRISPKAKVTSLISESKKLIKTMKHNFWLDQQFNRLPILIVLNQNIALLRDVAFLIAIAINIMVLVSYEYNSEGDSVNEHTSGAIETLGIIVIILSGIIVTFNLLKTAPLLIAKAWVGIESEQFNVFVILKRFLLSFYNLLTDFYVLYYILYASAAIFGLIISPFLFFFHLFDVLVRYPVLLNVVKAVWIPKKQILFTYFLFIVLMYVFTLFGYYWLRTSYESNFCESTWICLLTAIDKSFKADGGLGGFLVPVEGTEPDSKFLIRFFFDNIYFILLMIIMINIVSGIIIDTFGQLREQLGDYEEDLNTICFICGHKSEFLEKNSYNSKGFKHHIKNDHYMWNYLFYIAYLNDKKKTEYTGIESYVSEKLEKDEISWFPTYKALCLKPSTDKQETHEIIDDLVAIQKEQNQLQQMLDNIDTYIDKIEEQQKEYD